MTDIWNVTMNATDIESDQPSTIEVETLLYKFNFFNPPSCSTSGQDRFTNCTMKNILHPSTGAWTPLRENYTTSGWYNPHYYNTANVCLHAVSSNEDLLSSHGVVSIPKVPAGHVLRITPNPWRYGSTTITILADAFNLTLGKELVETKEREERTRLAEIQRKYREQRYNVSTTFGNLTLPNKKDQSSWWNPILDSTWVHEELIVDENNQTMHAADSWNGTNATNGNVAAEKELVENPCKFYYAIVEADRTGQNQTYRLAMKSFALRVNRTDCYGFVQLFPGVLEAVGWKKFNVSTRSFPFLVTASSSIVEIPLLLTLMPIVDRVSSFFFLCLLCLVFLGVFWLFFLSFGRP